MPVARPADPTPEAKPTKTDEQKPTPEPKPTTPEQVVKTTSKEREEPKDEPEEPEAEPKPVEQSPPKAPSGLTLSGDITYYATGLHAPSPQ
jgi:hypothetical protein